MDRDFTQDEIKELSWVQCENETCLKWRRISRQEVNKLGDESWFCHMNKDPSHNKCDDPEEDHRKTIYRANKCGYRYIFSQLPQGSLVWAKMTGHASWPAILSPDPVDGRYVTISKETGTPVEYHVEFLGPHHTHYWVHSSNVDVFGSSISGPQQKLRVSKRGKKSLTTLASRVKKNDHYAKSLRDAITEAEPLRLMTCEERLQKCIFVYKAKQEKTPQCRQTEPEDERPGVIGQPDVNLESKGKNKPRGRPPTCQKGSNSHNGAQSTKKSKKRVSFSSQPHIVHPPHQDDKSFSSSDDDSPAQAALQLIRTKEERLQADIQLLKQAEEKFERRLRRFSAHHGIPMKPSGPQWQGRQISRYQVYMAVQERGGYNMVSANRAWAKVYHEACGTSPGPRQSVSSAVKSFYTRNLLPYELYELRSSGNCATKAKSFEATDKKHRKHKRKHSSKNIPHQVTTATSSTLQLAAGPNFREHHIDRPITGQDQNFGPIANLEHGTPQPLLGDTLVSLRPAGATGCFHLPVGGQSHALCQPMAGQESSERALIGSQAEQCIATSQDFKTDVGPGDVDLLQEESTQALQELQAMENLLGSLDQQEDSDATTLSQRNSAGRLDRPTHIIETKPSPLSRRKPVLLEFYSMQYDNAECSQTGQVMTMTQKTVNDSKGQVPVIASPAAATPGNALSSANLPGSDEDGGVCPDDYGGILLNLDTVGDEIDRLNGELCQALLEI